MPADYIVAFIVLTVLRQMLDCKVRVEVLQKSEIFFSCSHPNESHDLLFLSRANNLFIFVYLE